jgi:hypothetical protein
MVKVCGELFRICCCIKQGNPLSALLFFLIVELRCRLNALMYADIFLFASSA